MYQVQCSDRIHEQLTLANKTSPSVSERLLELEENPLAHAKETGVQIIGDYYVNAGRYCIVFNIDHEEEIVNILSVCADAYLYKIITGRLLP
jgi:mRNA-degrading endonuclease RelE of RelBE toxin-antitoxin system